MKRRLYVTKKSIDSARQTAWRFLVVSTYFSLILQFNPLPASALDLPTLSGGQQDLSSAMLASDMESANAAGAPGFVDHGAKERLSEGGGGVGVSSLIPVDAEIDIADPDFGSAAAIPPGFVDEYVPARMFDGQPSSWVSQGRLFPQDITLAFDGDRSAAIDRVELAFTVRAGPDTWPSEIAITVSEDNPIDGFIEVARVAIDKRPGPHVIPVNRKARFLKVRILDNHGGNVTTVAEISVFEERADAASIPAGDH